MDEIFKSPLGDSILPKNSAGSIAPGNGWAITAAAQEAGRCENEVGRIKSELDAAASELWAALKDWRAGKEFLAFDPKSPEKADYRAMRATLSRVRARYRKNPYFNFILEFKAAYDSAGVVMEKIEAVKKILRQLEVAKERLAGAKASLAETKENEKRTIFPGSDTDDEAKIRILVGQLEAGNKNLRALDIFFAEQLPPS